MAHSIAARGKVDWGTQGRRDSAGFEGDATQRNARVKGRRERKGTGEVSPDGRGVPAGT